MNGESQQPWGEARAEPRIARIRKGELASERNATTVKTEFIRHFGRVSLVSLLSLLGAASTSRAGGTVVAWGGATVPAGLTNVVAVAAGYAHRLALKGDGTVAAWGQYFLPQAGPAGPSVPATVPPGLSNVAAIAGGMAHSLALKADGTVFAWGTNTDGQLDVPAGLSNVVAVAAGTKHSLALRSDGTVVAWGGNDSGQTSVPSGLTNVVAVAAGWANSLALKADGSVVGWGLNADRQTAMLAGLSNVVAIAAGDDNVALKADGTVVNWGFYYYYAVPSDLTNAVAISAGLGGPDTQIDLALRAGGTVAGWGFLFGPPLVPAELSNVVQVAAGGYGSLALVGGGPPFVVAPPVNGTVGMGGTIRFRTAATGALPLSYQWQFNGTNLSGATNAMLTLSDVQPNQAGAYAVTVSNAFGTAMSRSAVLTVVPFLVLAEPQDRTTFLGGAVDFSVAVEGSAPLSYQWRLNGVSLGWATNRSLALTNVQMNQAGIYTATVTNAFGKVRSRGASLSVVNVAAWGANANLSGNYVGQATVPGDLTNAVEVGGGFSHSLALRDGGTVTAWGDNSQGQCTIPAGLTDVVAVAAGFSHNLALKTDGTVTAWGYNNGGQTNVPSDLSDVVAIAAGAYHSLALKADGTVTAWGLDQFGATDVPRGLSNVVAISAAGSDSSLALTDDGRVLAWGDNYTGQTNVPTSLTDVVAIAQGGWHSLVLLDNGTVMAWGAGTVYNPSNYFDYGASFKTCRWLMAAGEVAAINR